jgi:Tol biopolymer transport system component
MVGDADTTVHGYTDGWRGTSARSLAGHGSSFPGGGLRLSLTILGRRSALASGVLLCAAPALAQIVNGSFEDPADHLAGWTLGSGARVEALQAGNFAPNPIIPPDGSWFALVSTGPGDVSGPGGDFDANGIADADGSSLSTVFTTTVAGESLSFEWAFLTDEVGPGQQGAGLYDDLFDVAIDGIPIVRGSVDKPGGSSPFNDTVPYDGMRYTVNAPGLTDNSDFGTAAGGGRTAFQRVCISIADPGTYTLEFRVADQADTIYDSGLLLDAVEVSSACDPTIQVTNSAESIVEAKGGALVFTAVTNRRAAMSGDGTTLAFSSNGNYTGDNPSLQDQIWVATRNGPAFDISRVTASVGAEFGDPGIGAGGRWLAFASTGDLALPGNGDGNPEIFRHDRATGGFLQITDTTGCTNSFPTINDDGSRIAFVSDCDLGFGATGTEIVFWDGTFRGIDTAGCQSRDPRISRDASGRYVTFLTDCDGAYPGTSNPDGGLEILQWDTETDLYLEVTDTPAGFVNDSIATSSDGRFVSFVSDADHAAGENPAGTFVVFRYDRSTGSFLQLVDGDPLALYTATAIDDSGTFVAVERLDIPTAAFDLYLLDSTVPGTLLPLAAGSATVFNNFPAVAVSANRPLVTFLSNGDFSGNNPDANVEIWATGTNFEALAAAVFCSTPDLAIPDRNSVGVTDVISVPVSGTLADLDVSVRIEHTFVGDLRVRLRHVDTGTTANIIDRPGRPPGAGCSGDDIDATLDDEAASSVEDQCVRPGPIAIEGRFTPDKPLSRFDGEDLLGDWELQVSDRARSDLGTLIEWCLVPTTQ